MSPKRKAVPKIVRHSRRAVANLAHANRNMRQAAQLATTAGQVVGTRLSALEHGEVARMVPEKLVAATAAGAASVHAAMRVVAQLYKDAAGEGIAAMALMQKVALARSPLEVLALQREAACAAWDRMIGRAFTAGGTMMRTQWAMVAPVASAANANARRLAR
jgi:hypothetical protein